ncbi:hypothetical protein EZV62_009339 [Acer yangbiense]|uniref:Uncharacterized protein n=1 Tax=Acer yangbiense TaxID=1000413 RepID=A0A5C7IGE9_9ROSI|nr:hypothetical protein EZV62_009339 [Acer yangbiense]
MHKLNSLQELELWQCTSITSIEKEGLPTSLTSLSITDLGFNRSLAEWGLHNLISLKTLEIEGCVYAESFPQDYTGLSQACFHHLCSCRYMIVPCSKNGAKRTREKIGSRFPASLALRLMADSSKIEGVKNKVDGSASECIALFWGKKK